MEKFNKLICYLLALATFAKDIHYSCHGESFTVSIICRPYQENMYEYIDQIKEICILGNDEEPLPSGEYLSRATSLIPAKSDNDDLENFRSMKALMLNTLTHIESMDGMTVGEENLIGNIAQDVQNNLGLVNQQVKE